MFVQTDYYRRTSDIDTTNNIQKAGDIVYAKLTPPPDLRVDSVAVPSSSYSGWFSFTVLNSNDIHVY